MPDSREDPNEEPFDYDNFEQPDGGFGWMIVFSAFCVQFLVLGTMNNFGILFTQLLSEFKSSKQETAWVGSINYGLMFLSGPITTSLCERLGCRPVAVLGGLIGSLGTLLASFSTDIYKMYLTEGFLFGVGASMCYFPSMIILPQYFSKKLSLANGLVSCGSGVGTMAMGPVIRIFIANFGWRQTVRLSSGLMLCVSLISLAYRPLIPPLGQGLHEESRPLFDFSVFQNRAYVMFTAALFIFMLSYFVPFVHLTQMALEYGIPLKKASLLIGIMSVFSTVGRLFFGRISDSPKVNRLYVYQIAMLSIGIANTLCPLMRNFPSLMAYCALFGFFEGCYVCQCAVLVGDIVGRERMAPGVGTLFGIKSIPLMLGAPIAGLLYDVGKSYQLAFYVAGAVPTIASCMMFAIPFLMPPPGDKFWKRRTVGSEQRLILTESDSSSFENQNRNNDDNNNDNNKRIANGHRSPIRKVDTVATNSSYLSINRYFVDLDKRVSLKELGSATSLGSLAVIPKTKSKKQSSKLKVVDRLTMV